VDRKLPLECARRHLDQKCVLPGVCHRSEIDPPCAEVFTFYWVTHPACRGGLPVQLFTANAERDDAAMRASHKEYACVFRSTSPPPNLAEDPQYETAGRGRCGLSNAFTSGSRRWHQSQRISANASSPDSWPRYEHPSRPGRMSPPPGALAALQIDRAASLARRANRRNAPAQLFTPSKYAAPEIERAVRPQNAAP